MKATLQPKKTKPTRREAVPADTAPTRTPPAIPSREMIERRAYEIWQRHGCPSGTEFHDWLAAEAELRSPR